MKRIPRIPLLLLLLAILVAPVIAADQKIDPSVTAGDYTYYPWNDAATDDSYQVAGVQPAWLTEYVGAASISHSPGSGNVTAAAVIDLDTDGTTEISIQTQSGATLSGSVSRSTSWVIQRSIDITLDGQTVHYDYSSISGAYSIEVWPVTTSAAGQGYVLAASNSGSIRYALTAGQCIYAASSSPISSLSVANNTGNLCTVYDTKYSYWLAPAGKIPSTWDQFVGGAVTVTSLVSSLVDFIGNIGTILVFLIYWFKWAFVDNFFVLIAIFEMSILTISAHKASRSRKYAIFQFFTYAWRYNEKLIRFLLDFIRYVIQILSEAIQALRGLLPI